MRKKMNNLFTKGTLVLFQGDSITDCDRSRMDGNSLGTGYPAKIDLLWKEFFPDSGIRFLNRGISGDRTRELLMRYQADFVDIKPDVLSILIGINDTWRRYDSEDATPVELFEGNYRKLLTGIKRDLPGTKIIIIEPFLLNSMPDMAVWRTDLDPKIQSVRLLAKEFADVFIPMDGIFASHAVSGIRESDMSEDGVHPTGLGHGIIAAEWLKALGLRL
jgi:lysophospholipase L1-like esterase